MEVNVLHICAQFFIRSVGRSVGRSVWPASACRSSGGDLNCGEFAADLSVERRSTMDSEGNSTIVAQSDVK